jgi:hypothetical protein
MNAKMCWVQRIERGRTWLSTPAGQRLLLLAVILAGFGLRLHHLDGPSLWSEEGLYLQRARQLLAESLANNFSWQEASVTDTGVPATAGLLHLWSRLAGESVFSLRLLAAIAGTASLPLFFGLAAALLDRGPALLGAFLLAISPYHIWLSQEIGFESLLLFWTLLATYGLLGFLLTHGPNRVSNGRSVAWLAAWLVPSLAGLFSHPAGAIPIACGWLVLLAAAIVRWGKSMHASKSERRQLLLGGVAVITGLILTIVIFLPRLKGDPAMTFVFVPAKSLWFHTAGTLGTGIAPGLIQQWWRFAPAVILAVAGLIAVFRGRRRPLAVFAAGYLGLPLAAIFALHQASPYYNASRLLFLLLPPFLLLVTAGITYRWQHWRGRAWALGIAVVAIQLAWLGTQNRAESWRKDDIRGLAQQVAGLARPEDVIVIQDAGTALAFDHYYHGSAAWVAVPGLAHHDPGPAVDALQAAAGPARRLWLLDLPRPRTGLPPHTLVDWVSQHGKELHRQQWPTLWLPLGVAAYAWDQTVMRLDTAPVATWDGRLTLLSYGSASAPAAAGSFWQPRFLWQRSPTADGQYTLYFRLTDGQGQTWAEIEWLLWPDYPPGFWPANEPVGYEPLIPLPAGLPAGSYRVWLQVARTADGTILAHDGPQVSRESADLLLADSLQVRPAVAPDGLDRLPAYTWQQQRFGRELLLLGHQIPDAPYRPGHPVPVTLFWQALSAPSVDYRLRLQLFDSQGRPMSETISGLTRDDYPPSRWRANELIMSQASLPVPADALGGQVTVALSLLPPDSDRPLAVGWPLGRLTGPEQLALTSVQVVPWPLNTELPPIPRPLEAIFGQPEIIKLHGFNLAPAEAAAGDLLSLTLFWQALAPITNNYAVFVHFASEDGQVLAQGDGLPLFGSRPTTSWRADEVFRDEHLIQLPADLPPGRYYLWVGFYDPVTGLRPPVSVDGRPAADDRVLLTEVLVDG